MYGDYNGRRDSILNLWGNLHIGGVTFRIGEYWDNHYRQEPFYIERSRLEDQCIDNYQDIWGPRPNERRWSSRGTSASGVMLRRSWLYVGPDWSHPRAGLLYPWTNVTIAGCLPDWSWCDVISRGSRGWVAGRDVGGSWQGRRQSINLIAPHLGIAILPFVFQAYWNQHYRNQPFYAERDRWGRQYVQHYRPTWGPGPGEQHKQSRQRQAPDPAERGPNKQKDKKSQPDMIR
ncbi:hypothetical protein CAP39_07905 [Sphingomonas sp. IBVSS1]|nr:hypothetical protein CAP39_07905 [Sphingomonas sp. IBVSS1]